MSKLKVELLEKSNLDYAIKAEKRELELSLKDTKIKQLENELNRSNKFYCAVIYALSSIFFIVCYVLLNIPVLK